MNALLLAVALAAVPPPSPRQLVVSGDARITFKPNQVMVNLAVVANGRDEAGVRKTVEERGRQVVEACKKAGVEPQNVVSGYAVVSPQYRGNEVVGQSASESFTVTVTNLPRLDEVLAAAVKAGAQPAGAVTLVNTEHARYETQARKAAATDAHERAKAMLEALGAKVGLPVSVSDRTSSLETMAGGAFSVSPDGKVSSSFAQRDFTVTSLVTASFDIEPPQ